VSGCLLEPQWEAQLELELDGQLLEELLANTMDWLWLGRKWAYLRDLMW
jgi:hypothetical protein